MTSVAGIVIRPPLVMPKGIAIRYHWEMSSKSPSIAKQPQPMIDMMLSSTRRLTLEKSTGMINIATPVAMVRIVLNSEIAPLLIPNSPVIEE